MYSNRRYDEIEPRPVPKPTQFQEITARPEVPELSLVFDNDNLKNNPKLVSSQTKQETYNEWKSRQAHSPVFKQNHYYNSHENPYYATSSFSDYNQYAYNRMPNDQKTTYKPERECHKCSFQNNITVKDIYTMMQMQNDQIKFLLETIQKLLANILTNQQTSHKCCPFKHENCEKNEKIFKKNESPQDNSDKSDISSKAIDLKQNEKIQNVFKINENTKKFNETNNSPKPYHSSDHNINEMNKNKKISKCDNEKELCREEEKANSVHSDESFELNANDVKVNEIPMSPEPSIHIEMNLSSDESSSSSETEEQNDKKIEVGWTMYNNILGQVNNLLGDKSEANSETIKATETVKPVVSKPIDFESYKKFMLTKNGEMDSSLQMQALAMQYLSPEQAIKFDMNKHFVPVSQPNIRSTNNFSFATLQYMERYQLIKPQSKSNSEMIPELSKESLAKKKKPSRKNKVQSKILNVTELKQQPKLL